VIFKILISTFCLVTYVGSIRSHVQDNAKFTDKSISNLDAQETNRHKRTVVFRPLFVYRQQQIEKTRLKDDREQRIDANHAVQENQQVSHQQQPLQPKSNTGSTEVHHHHHHHHHHHYPEGVQQVY